MTRLYGAIKGRFINLYFMVQFNEDLHKIL